MKKLIIVIAILFHQPIFGQEIQVGLNRAIENLVADTQFRHAGISLYITDGEGKVIFNKNGETGMAPASTQKVITGVTAYELLGKDFRYSTQFGYGGNISAGRINCLLIKGNGDPVLGSSRFNETKESVIFNRIIKSLREKGIRHIEHPSKVINPDTLQTLPDGWIWQDIGNYYGAAPATLNWRENQFEVIFKGRRLSGTPALLQELRPKYTDLNFINDVITGAAGTGDNAYIYPGLNSTTGLIKGTVPPGTEPFIISGAITDPSRFFLSGVDEMLHNEMFLNAESRVNPAIDSFSLLFTHLSPALDSINYWFLKKSVNLYGEALVRTIGQVKGKSAGTESGLEVIRNFWAMQGIDRGALQLLDGSGLSPANRVTAKTLVQVLLYAKNKVWFNSFYEALPLMNQLKMKDGYISGVRAYTGFAKARNGKNYVFAFMVNNFYGSAAAVREKMYRVLDLLK